MRYRTKEEPTPRSVHLLISFAVRYPEITTVRYDPRRQTLRLSFLVTGALAPEEFQRVERKVRETLDVYHMLEQREPLVIELSHEGLGEVNSIGLERDIASLTPEELFTLVEVLREQFAGRVIAENIEFIGEDEIIAQDEIIEEMLDSMAERRSNANLIAIREDGRLMFFHK